MIELSLILIFSMQPSRHRRQATDSIVWCAGGSKTCVTVNMTSATSPFNTKDPSYILGQTTLVQSYEQILNHIKTVGDGVINNGTSNAVGTTEGSGEVDTNSVVNTFSLLGKAPGASKITVNDANNHHTTWGALGAAVVALNGALSTAIGYGTVVFGIYDEKNEVGKGTFAPSMGGLPHWLVFTYGGGRGMEVLMFRRKIEVGGGCQWAALR